MRQRAQRFGKAFTLILTTILMTVSLSVLASAAGKEKLVKTRKEYWVSPESRRTTSYSYDKYGNIIEEKYVYGTAKAKKKTYWKGTGFLKTRALTSDYGARHSDTYLKNGLLKQTKGDDYTLSYSYTYYGNGKVKSKVVKWASGTFEKKGTVMEKIQYNKQGDVTYWYTGGQTYRAKYTYKKGLRTKATIKASGISTTITCDNKGNIKKEVVNDKDIGEKNTYTFKNKYKGGYLVEAKRYKNGKYDGKTTYTWTSKKYSKKYTYIDKINNGRFFWEDY